jgi:hypothetical protein
MNRDVDNRDMHEMERYHEARIEALLIDRSKLIQRIAELEAANATQRDWLRQEVGYAKK